MIPCTPSQVRSSAGGGCSSAPNLSTLSTMTPSKRTSTKSAPSSARKPRRSLESMFNNSINLDPGVDEVYRVIHNTTGQLGGNGSNGAIYGELTAGSMQKVVDVLKKRCQLGCNSSFIDVGSGLGKPNFHVAQAAGVELSYGIELEEIRWQLSINNQRALLAKKAESDNDDSVTEISGAARSYFEHGDVLSARTFDPFTHVNMFDLGFPPPTLKLIGEMFNRSQAPYLISYQPPRKIIDEYTFNVEFMEQFSTHLHGSGESHMMYLYKRIVTSKNAPELDGNVRIHTVDPFFQKGVTLARQGGGDRGASLRKFVEDAFKLYTERPRPSRSAIRR